MQILNFINERKKNLDNLVNAKSRKYVIQKRTSEHKFFVEQG